MGFISETLENLDGMAVVILIMTAIFISVLTELIKLFDKKDNLSATTIQAITLLLGVTFGIGFAWATQGDWVTYVLVGLAASYASNGIYDQLAGILKVGK